MHAAAWIGTDLRNQKNQIVADLHAAVTKVALLDPHFPVPRSETCSKAIRGKRKKDDEATYQDVLPTP